MNTSLIMGALALAVLASPALDAQTVVDWNHTWRYFHPMGTFPSGAGNFNTTWFMPTVAPPSNLQTADNPGSTYTGQLTWWTSTATGLPGTTSSFDAGTSAGPIGYDTVDFFTGGGVLTLANNSTLSALGKNLTTPNTANRFSAYYRTVFTVPAGGLIFPVLDYIIDDGAFVYLDGNLILKVNLASNATDTYTQLAANTTGTESGIRRALLSLDVGTTTGEQVTPSSLTGNAVVSIKTTQLAAGLHTLAIGLKNQAASSSDLAMAVRLRSGSPLNRQPYLQSASPTSMTVRWQTALSEAGYIKVKKPDDTFVPTTNIAYSRVGNEHTAVITGLSPQTTYRYEVGLDGGTQVKYFPAAGAASDTAQFNTAPPEGTASSTRIWAIGDGGDVGAGNLIKTLESFKNFNNGSQVDVMLMLGDNAYNNGTQAQYTTNVFDVENPSLSTLRNQMSKTPLWSTIGNHETQDSNNQTGQLPTLAQSTLSAYADIFNFPTNGGSGGVASGTEKYYSFNHGNIHFVCLDSQTVDRTATGAGSMLNWLANDLQQNDKEWLIAFWHHPPYSKGGHDSDTEVPCVQMRQNAVKLLESFGVDLVLNGHSHNYQRTGLIHGHYGVENTFATSHIKAQGAGGAMRTGAEEIDGAYIKLGATPGPTTNPLTNASVADANKTRFSTEGAVYCLAGHGARALNSFSGIAITAPQIQAGKKYQIVSIGTTDFSSIGAINPTIGTVFVASNPTGGTGTVLRVDTAGELTIGSRYAIVSVGTTNFMDAGALSNNVGTVFTAQQVVSGTGVASLIRGHLAALPMATSASATTGSYDNVWGSMVIDIQGPRMDVRMISTNSSSAPFIPAVKDHFTIMKGYRKVELVTSPGYTPASVALSLGEVTQSPVPFGSVGASVGGAFFPSGFDLNYDFDPIQSNPSLWGPGFNDGIDYISILSGQTSNLNLLGHASWFNGGMIAGVNPLAFYSPAQLYVPADQPLFGYVSGQFTEFSGVGGSFAEIFSTGNGFVSGAGQNVWAAPGNPVAQSGLSLTLAVSNGKATGKSSTFAAISSTSGGLPTTPVTSLGTGHANDINSSWQVVGWSGNQGVISGKNPGTNAFTNTNATALMAPPLSVGTPIGNISSKLYALNDAGMAVGWSGCTITGNIYKSIGLLVTRPMIAEQQRLSTTSTAPVVVNGIDLTNLVAGNPDIKTIFPAYGYGSFGAGINNRGQIIGNINSNNTSSGWRGVILDPSPRIGPTQMFVYDPMD